MGLEGGENRGRGFPAGGREVVLTQQNREGGEPRKTDKPPGRRRSTGVRVASWPRILANPGVGFNQTGVYQY